MPASFQTDEMIIADSYCSFERKRCVLCLHEGQDEGCTLHAKTSAKTKAKPNGCYGPDSSHASQGYGTVPTDSTTSCGSNLYSTHKHSRCKQQSTSLIHDSEFACWGVRLCIPCDLQKVPDMSASCPWITRYMLMSYSHSGYRATSVTIVIPTRRHMCTI